MTTEVAVNAVPINFNINNELTLLAWFFASLALKPLYRLGEIRDRSFEQQRYRASGLNLVTAAIVLWNTVYLERATSALRAHGKALDDTLLQYLSPLGWEHINLTGDYLWRSSAKVGAGKFRPLRPLPPA
ncbi:Tn3 family transposase [Klebsiella michiganensis]|jgi:hypothetical protein|nr:Tn3 family transposase [Klebsiella michiganensis]